MVPIQKPCPQPVKKKGKVKGLPMSNKLKMLTSKMSKL